MRGHQDLDGDYRYKEGDAAGHILHAETTDKILLFADNGRFTRLPLTNCRAVAALVGQSNG